MSPWPTCRRVGADDDRYDEVAANEAIADLLAVLTQSQREVVWGRVFGGLSSAEIVERLDTTPGNVDVMFFNALKKLRKGVETP